MLKQNRPLGKLVLSLLLFASFLAQSTEDCRVMSDCADGTVKWKTLPPEGTAGRPGKRGPMGLPGAKGEPGLGVNVEELEAQLEEGNNGPSVHFVSHTVTWDVGRWFCRNIGKRICSMQQLCVEHDGHVRLIPDVIPGDNWVPVIDSHNAWLQVGEHAGSTKRVCFTHTQHYGVKPAWGTSTGVEPYKGYVICCHDPGDSDISLTRMRYQYIGNSATYASSRSHCRSQGLRLCYASEVCRNNKPQFGVFPGDMWVAVNDRTNEWVEIGNYRGRTCWAHGVRFSLPTWGIRTDGSLLPYVGYVICCVDSS